ncbi:MAG: CmcI family methyltransferase [Rickettsia endosymbiont of Ixodes persulcatus]|nr:CmcI family methyltransferase [Rickettsia endosymbiont of Ixodes persulcatus]MCZ6914579.1 CmcI family methyltransferase [Rickettsia endosymbiont of Ixodes persulcatus]
MNTLEKLYDIRNKCLSNNPDFLKKKANKLLVELGKMNYSYNFDWFGFPIIQLPQDILAFQEIIYQTAPTIIIEIGIAHGGGVIFYASMLNLFLIKGRVLGIDILIHECNRKLIEAHPLSNTISLLKGSSVSNVIYKQVCNFISKKDRVMVIFDSNHTHDHVLNELKLYASLVTKGCYMIVMDTAIEDMPSNYFPNKPWGKGNNPKTAVREFLKYNSNFVVDTNIENKLIITAAPNGYLKCVK